MRVPLVECRPGELGNGACAGGQHHVAPADSCDWPNTPAHAFRRTFGTCAGTRKKPIDIVQSILEPRLTSNDVIIYVFPSSSTCSGSDAVILNQSGNNHSPEDYPMWL